MKIKSIIFVIFCLNVFIVHSFAQEYKGIVYELNDEGEQAPLPGVNIYWYGTQQGTVSRLDGIHSDIQRHGLGEKRI